LGPRVTGAKMLLNHYKLARLPTGHIINLADNSLSGTECNPASRNGPCITMPQ